MQIVRDGEEPPKAVAPPLSGREIRAALLVWAQQANEAGSVDEVLLIAQNLIDEIHEEFPNLKT